MAELNLKQITDKLNNEFTGESRKLVFWYDERGEFLEDIDDIELINAKVYHLERDNQFYTKYFLECVDKTTSYLVYAPFAKPDVKENHLEDTLLYSKRFFADRASLLSVDLGIEEKYKHIIEKHIKFFANKERMQRFYDLEVELLDEKKIYVALLSALCKSKIASFEEVTRIVLSESITEDNKYIHEMEKFDLLETFWKLSEYYYGYVDAEPTLNKLITMMFITYTDKQIEGNLPTAWTPYVSNKVGNVITLLNNMMNNVVYQEKFDMISERVATSINAGKELSAYPIQDIIDCDVYRCIDDIVIKWLIGRLETEDLGAKANGLSIIQLCEKRLTLHYSKQLYNQYKMLICAYKVIANASYRCPDALKDIVEGYCNNDCLIDTDYRKFYYYYDQIEEADDFEKLQTLVENIYANKYLTVQLPKFSREIAAGEDLSAFTLQRNFYNKYLNNTKERTVVIISDAMRYEVGRELFAKLKDNPKCMKESKLEKMLGILPAYTGLGMASLLPHKEITVSDKYDIEVDGAGCKGLIDRERILQNREASNCCIQFDELASLKGNDFKSFFTGKHLIYVYHNQIDARAETPISENEVFNACEEAVSEILSLVQKIASGGNTYRFIITADHGFLYRRNKVDESDKITGITDKLAFKNRRFVVAQDAIKDNGVLNIPFSRFVDGAEDRIISTPEGNIVFKVAGGMNYVHGGLSPQEIILPVLDIKMDRGRMETTTAQIALVSTIQKITNLMTNMEFIQSDAVSDTVKKTTYKLFFISEDNEKISNENIYVADKRNSDSKDRMFRMRFTFKNKTYDKTKQYYLVVYDENTGIEAWRHPVIIDIAFAGNFGFGV